MANKQTSIVGTRVHALHALTCAQGVAAEHIIDPDDDHSAPTIMKFLAAAGITVPAPWCLSFLAWCFYQAGGAVPWYSDGAPGYVPALVDWAKARDLYGVLGAPGVFTSPGDLFIMGAADHVGIVESVPGMGTYHTIEGNTSVPGMNEIGVARKTHHLGDGWAAARIAWPPSSLTLAPPASPGAPPSVR